jgi:hypothetical protein
MRKARVYLDTSVIGGCLDEEFAEASQALLTMARRGEITLVVSKLLVDELVMSPGPVAQLFEDLPGECIERVDVTGECTELRDRYLAGGGAR